MSIHALPRVSLAQVPTPIQPLPGLSAELGGPALWVKRDDQTGLTLGGNKTRKLEFLVADALEQGASTLITAGATQSNHCRQTAGAAAIVGLACELVLCGEAPAIPNGNALIDSLCGATLHYTTRERRHAAVEAVAESVRARGGKPYVIPVGGSNGLGAVGYVNAMHEFSGQCEADGLAFDWIVHASSSGGTQAGLVLGARLVGYAGSILGISIDQDKSFTAELCAIADEAAACMDSDARFTGEDFLLNTDYLGDGYGVVGDPEREAIRLCARTEGLILDPVYTGRGMAGLIDLVRRGGFDPRAKILFWHTGGAPALFAYAAELA